MGFMKKFFGGKNIEHDNAWMTKGVVGRPGRLPIVDYAALAKVDEEIQRAVRHYVKYGVCYTAYLRDGHPEDEKCASYHLLAFMNIAAKRHGEFVVMDYIKRKGPYARPRRKCDFNRKSPQGEGRGGL
jgi:hypothetical protein